MNCPHSTTDDVLDFASLAQEAVKVMQREERVNALTAAIHEVRMSVKSGYAPSAIRYKRDCFLSEV